MSYSARTPFDPTKWLAALLGVVAVGGGIAFQFVPAARAEALAAVGRTLVVSLPLMVAGLGFVAVAAIRHVSRGGELVRRSTRTVPVPARVPVADQEVFAEEIDEEINDAPLPPLPPVPSGVISAKPVRPTAAPFRGPVSGGGQVALSTSKYVNSGSQNFRKGTTHETQS